MRVPLIDWLPVKAPPAALEVLAVQEVVYAELQVTVTAWPRLMLAAAAGCEKLTVGAGAIEP
jgi:hypothetical protein